MFHVKDAQISRDAELSLTDFIGLPIKTLFQKIFRHPTVGIDYIVRIVGDRLVLVNTETGSLLNAGAPLTSRLYIGDETFDAPVLLDLICGHVRPSRWVQVGDNARPRRTLASLEGDAPAIALWGTLFQSGDRTYVLAQVGCEMAALICLQTGNRWSVPTELENGVLAPLTKSDVVNISGHEASLFEIVESAKFEYSMGPVA